MVNSFAYQFRLDSVLQNSHVKIGMENRKGNRADQQKKYGADLMIFDDN